MLDYWDAIKAANDTSPWMGDASPLVRDAVVVVDYHKGNLSSVARGLSAAGAKPFVTDNPDAIERAVGVVIPGVGSFEDAINFMRMSGQLESLRRVIVRGVPLLGICLGMQVLFERGNESASGRWVDGLGLLEGEAVRLPSGRLKVPHMGWNQLELTPQAADCPLLEGVTPGSNFYFTHSYGVTVGADQDFVAARTLYATPFASVVWRGMVFGTQFHPEKSAEAGARILSNFVRITKAYDRKLRTRASSDALNGVDALLKTLVPNEGGERL